MCISLILCLNFRTLNTDLENVLDLCVPFSNILSVSAVNFVLSIGVLKWVAEPEIGHKLDQQN